MEIETTYSGRIKRRPIPEKQRASLFKAQICSECPHPTPQRSPDSDNKVDEKFLPQFRDQSSMAQKWAYSLGFCLVATPHIGVALLSNKCQLSGWNLETNVWISALMFMAPTLQARPTQRRSTGYRGGIACAEFGILVCAEGFLESNWFPDPAFTSFGKT